MLQSSAVCEAYNMCHPSFARIAEVEEFVDVAADKKSSFLDTDDRLLYMLLSVNISLSLCVLLAFLIAMIKK